MPDRLEVMTPKHPRWNEFVERLNGPEGCNFTQDDQGKYRWRCAGGEDKTYATAILKSMGAFDIPASLAFFEEHGGFCDCEILSNVEVSCREIEQADND